MLKCNLFKFLDPQYIEYCVKYSQEVIFPIGTQIFKQGESSSEVYYIKQGDIEQSIRPQNKENQKIKVKDISTDIAAPSEEFESAQDDFDPEKFLKSNLFNQTLYEKGGPVSKNRQFWNLGGSEDFDFVVKLKEELNYKHKKFQKVGIRHTQIEVEDEVKKFMISSLSQKFSNKGNGSFLNKATTQNQCGGLKLALISRGSYFGDEILSNHPLLHFRKKSDTIVNTFCNVDDGNGSNSSKSLQNQQNNKYHHDHHHQPQNIHNNQRNQLTKSMTQYSNQHNNSKTHSKDFKNSQYASEKSYQLQRDHQGATKEINDDGDEQEFKQQLRQYTVMCTSAQCILLKISMELYLSFTYLNQKERFAERYLQTQFKEKRRLTKLEDHANLLQMANKIFSPRDVIKLKHKSILSDKIVEFIHSNDSSRLATGEQSNTGDQSPPLSTLKIPETPKKNNPSLSINASNSQIIYNNNTQIIDSNCSIHTIESPTKKQIQNTNNSSFNALGSVKSVREKNLSTSKPSPQKGELQNLKLKYRHSIAHSSLGGEQAQRQQLSQLQQQQQTIASNTIEENNEDQQKKLKSRKKNSVFYQPNNSALISNQIGNGVNEINQKNNDFLSQLSSKSAQKSSEIQRGKKTIFNYSNQNFKNDISSQQPYQMSMSPLNQKKKEEIDQLYYTFSSIIQQEEKRQKQISLMTNSLERMNKVITPTCQDPFKYSPVASPKMSNRQTSDFNVDNQSGQKSQYLQNSQSTTPQNSTMHKNFFFKQTFSDKNEKLQSSKRNSYVNKSSSSYNTLNTYLSNTNNLNGINGESTINNRLSFNRKSNTSNPSMNFEGLEDFQFFQGQNSSSKQQLIPSLSDVRKSNHLIQKQSQSQQQPQIDNSSYNNLGNTNNLVAAKNGNTNLYQLGINLSGGLEMTSSLLKERGSGSSYQNCLSFMMKKPTNNESLNLMLNQQSPSIGQSMKKLENEQSKNDQLLKLSSNSFDKSSSNSPLNPLNELSTLNLNQCDSINTQDFQSVQHKVQKVKSDKTLFPLPQSYILKPLFNEILQNEKTKQEQKEKQEKPQRVKIEIYRDFYIKKYRKAYKQACSVNQNSSKQQVVSLFDSVEQIESKKQKLSEEEMSLLIQKKLQIDKKFPNSQRAKQINEFFNKHVQKLNDHHKGEMLKCKRARDINIVTTNALLNKLEEQNKQEEIDLDFAGTHFNFVSSKENSKQTIKSNKNNTSASAEICQLK